MNEITTQELKKLVDSGKDFILLDCRGADYFNWEHLPHAVNLRYKYVEEKAEKLLKNKNAVIITSCDGFTCRASVRCYDNLKKIGYTNVLEYSGGVADWLAHGYETVRDKKYHIAPNVYRFPNQTFYGESVGSYLIEEKSFLLLIDGPMQLIEEHEDFILHFGKPMKVFMSHGPTAGDAKILQEKYKAQIYLHKNDERSQWLTVKPNVLFTDEFDFNENLHVIHTPGHSSGSSVIYDSRNKILFTGDHVEGNQTGNIHDFMAGDDDPSAGDIQERFTSAKKLLNYNFDAIFPFHYEPITQNAKSILNSYVKKYEHNNH